MINRMFLRDFIRYFMANLNVVHFCRGTLDVRNACQYVYRELNSNWLVLEGLQKMWHALGKPLICLFFSPLRFWSTL